MSHVLYNNYLCRYLLLGGRKGHIASIDWKSKELICEFQIQETTRDIQ